MLGIFGNISAPGTYTGYQDIANGGLANFVSALIALITTLGGIFVMINFISAGYIFITNPAEPQKLTEANNKMIQSLIGLMIIAAAFVIAAFLGYLFFKDSGFLLNPIFQKIS